MRVLIAFLLLASTSLAADPNCVRWYARIGTDGRPVVIQGTAGERIYDALVIMTGGPTPTPSPDPSPGPGPIPPIPEPDPQPVDLVDGPFQIARKVRDLALKVPSPNRKAECAAMAAGFIGVADQIRTVARPEGKLSGTMSIINAIAKANTAAVGTSMPQWEQFGSAIVEIVKPLQAAERLSTGEAWESLLREAASGLTFAAGQ